MILFKDSKQRSSIRQGNQPNGRVLSSIEGGSLIYVIRKDDIGSLCKASLDYSALQLNNTGHLKVAANEINVVSSNGTQITTATTTIVLTALQNVFFYRLYNLYLLNISAAIEIAGWSFNGNGDGAASQKWIKSYGQNQDLFINMVPGYVDLQPGTGLSIVSANGGAQLEWTVGYSIIRVE